MKLSLISWLNLQYRLMIIYSGCSQPPWILCTKLIARTTTNTSLQAGGQATIIFKLKRHTYLHHHHHVYIYIYTDMKNPHDNYSVITPNFFRFLWLAFCYKEKTKRRKGFPLKYLSRQLLHLSRGKIMQCPSEGSYAQRA